MTTILTMICDVFVLLVVMTGTSSSGPRGMAIVAVDNVVCVRFARPNGRVDEAAVARCIYHTIPYHTIPLIHLSYE